MARKIEGGAVGIINLNPVDQLTMGVGKRSVG